MEYSCPVHGTWNIVHIGMLVPQAHQIFVCGESCLRGVVLTAAEMGARERFSTVDVQEHDFLEGTMEQLVIDGVNDVLRKLPYKPPAVLVFTACMHEFAGCDYGYIYGELRKVHPGIDFAECYMYPIMDDTKTPSDPMLRRRMYELIHTSPERDGGINIVGNLFKIDSGSELMEAIRSSGRIFRDITGMKTYAEFQTMGKSSFSMALHPAASEALTVLCRRLDQQPLYIPASYDPAVIRKNMRTVCSALSVPLPDLDRFEAAADAALERARDRLAGWTLALDYTASTAPLSLAKLLLEHGFALKKIFIDKITEPAEAGWIRSGHPEVEFLPVVQPRMVFYAPVHERHYTENVLCIGEKAAYFMHSNHFVILMEDGDLYGFGGIARLADMMIAAAETDKDTRTIVQQKGWGAGNETDL
ncbi:MAG: hypothetical protein LKF96_06255 [Treponema sp.]|jgi:hypothetical protein|nr:hypothetical protein [Treponema sp.]